MRKITVTLLLLLAIAGSMAAGTLSSYTTTVDSLGNGSVVAKEFVFTGNGADSFQQGIKIAPSETVVWRFNVKNYKNSVITETDLYYKLSFTVAATQGKHAIDPLKVTVKDQNGGVLKSVTGTGTFDVFGTFPLAAAGQERDYIVELSWPSGNNDISFAGGNYGTTVRVDAAASQIPLGGDTGNTTNDFNVLYETTVPWQNGQSGHYNFQYQITITNNTDKVISDWYMLFSLANDRLSGAVWRAKNQSGGLPDGSYKIVNPAYNNQTTDNLLPGQSVSFGGQAVGMGTDPIKDISVGGSNTAADGNVALNCEYGKASIG